VWACGALAVGLGGCAAASSTVSVPGKNLTIYASVPSSQAPEGQQAQDVLDAERLALQQAGGQVGKFKVMLKPLVLKPVAGTKAGEPSAKEREKEISANARRAIQDSSTVAYLGELPSGTSGTSVQINNQVDILQVSPTDTALELTQATAAVPGSPDRYYPSKKSFGRTFGRVVPSTELEAKAQVQEMRMQHVKRLYVGDDGGGDAYGAAVALAVSQQAAASSITVVGTGLASPTKVEQSRADALFLGVRSEGAAATLFNSAVTVNPKLKLFGPSALDDDAFASALTPGAGRTVSISAPGFYSSRELTPAGQKFDEDFAAAYHHAPASQAIFGYEAMSVVLDALRRAGGSAGNRSDVVRDFFAVKDKVSVLGTYSIESGGDIKLSGSAPFTFSHIEAGRLVPFSFVPTQG